MDRADILERDVLRRGAIAFTEAYLESEHDDKMERRIDGMRRALAAIRVAESETVSLESNEFKGLSKTELEILSMLAGGMTYKQIAAVRGGAHSTVRTHLHAVYKKLGVADRAQASIMYLRARDAALGRD